MEETRVAIDHAPIMKSETRYGSRLRHELIGFKIQHDRGMIEWGKKVSEMLAEIEQNRT